MYIKSTTSFTQINEDERPREKALKYGIRSLKDNELMAIIFSTGTQGRSVLEMSQDILDDNDGHLSKVANIDAADFLKRYKGIGPAKALTLLAGLELGRRAARDAANLPNAAITSSLIAYNVMHEHLANLDHEEFWVLLLNQSNRPITAVNVGRGGVSATAVDVRLILKHAVDHLASSMLIFHNHPSGNLLPSRQDEALTQKIRDGLALLDIRLNDHIIVAPGGYWSFHDHGKI